MKVEDIKWYSPLEFFVGAILSFADPITDILTLVEFYRTDHKTWFGVGLTFVLLPCLVSPALFLVFRRDDANYSSSLYAKTAFCAFHPFSAAFARIEALIFCLKIWWFGNDEIDDDAYDKAENLLDHIAFAVLFEAVLESAPQFIIQLYAISVQEEPAAIIQMISLPVSFLTLAWAFTKTDERTLVLRNIISKSSDLKVKHKVALYLTHLLLLSSRLFAICYFTVSYKWWVIGVLSFHSCPVVIAILIMKRGIKYVFLIILFMGIHSLRDDASAFFADADSKGVSLIVLLSQFLFLVENYFMILMFYFNDYVKTWYSIPVTVCVCVFSVLGSTMRI
ncbi:uncharacterized protein LOC111331845 [Stylophora pistillata]|uniref:XK-related protein n=1 Tax=Stylophora pistillata TaxID=50429 RepID=A0A2B4S705_STYPI|nr:uncharacterized protein LOC111331845 [Stylophora pistillata]PFX24302.1 XK-related protein 9 [Stylophora pistillata]